MKTPVDDRYINSNTREKYMKVIVILCMILLISACVITENTQSIENKGVWKTLSPMQTERTEVEVVLANEQLYVIGGFEKQEDITNKIEIFSPKTGWSFGPPLPKPLHHGAAVVIDNTIYVIGGYTDGWTPVNTLYALNLNEWVEKTPMPTARGALEAGVIDGKIYAVGGKADKILGTLERYDPATDSWETLAPMPTQRDHLASGVVNNKLYVLGGRKGTIGSNLNVNEEYDPATNTWTTKAPMPTARGGIDGAVFKDKIYVLGGEALLKTFDENEAYDPITDMWEQLPPIPTARHGLGAASIGRDIHVIAGGRTPGGSYSNLQEIYIPEQN